MTLHRLESSRERIGTSQLARMFNVKAPSVTGMLHRLGERGWIRYRRYRPPELTTEGRQIAVYLIRSHRLLETFLVKFLDYSLDDVHEEVRKLEHSISDGLLMRIDQKLDHPSYDLRGDPIPGINGQMPDHKLIPLTHLEEGSTAKMGGSDSRIRHLMTVLNSIGADPGSTVTRLPGSTNKMLAIRIGQREVEIDDDLARLIWVNPG
ncbi:iron-dependent repressor IdeR [bacterium BMS3Bbin04]|nr:iron-dependent repressor IdeR [bacterium BMS3Bbin04]